MDSCNGGTQNSKLQTVSIMSVPPLKVTEPRRVRQVLVTDTLYPKAIQGCYHIVLYYEKLNEEDHGWSLAGWIVESLARVLLDHPLLAGRLQRKEVSDGTVTEIVSNDSGIRLLEARYPTTLKEFLELNEKEDLESELVFWKEIDEHHPEFCPLFYVTNFDCGGYSIGISCSLLLAEVLVVENFLKKWVQIHNKMLPQNKDTKTPIFHHTSQENSEPLPSEIISRTQSKNGVQSMVFKITAEDVDFSKEYWGEIVMFCIEDAEQKLDIKMGSDFSLVVKDSAEVIKVETCSKTKSKYNLQGLLDIQKKILGATWNDFGVYEVAFHEGNKPVHVSCWIASNAAGDDGHVMAVPCPEENACAVIIVSPLVET
ncbi:Transferase [Sesbania bispinosa]|nr:Transferase [Sesbania bispinosa]